MGRHLQDETHEKKRDVDVFEYHEKNLSGGKSGIGITHTACQNNENQKEIGL